MTMLAAARPAFDASRSAAARSRQRQRSASFGPHLAVQRDGVGADRDGAAGLVRGVVSSPGQPLDPGVRSVMEARLGHDFSHVRVHTDSDAARSADAINANAYTAGNHIVFGAGRFAPAAPDGQRVVAHELAHVIQQERGPVAGRDVGDGVAVSHPEDPFERDAVRSSERAMTPLSVERKLALSAAAPYLNKGATQLAVQRDAAGVIGAVAGVVGAVLAGIALYVAWGQWKRPLNANATAQGVTMQPNPFSFQTPAKEPTTDEDKKKFEENAEKAPKVDKVLELRTDDDNDTTFNLQRNTDGTNIIAASIVPGETKGYQGGYNGSVAAVNFSAMQSFVPPEHTASKTPSKPTSASKKTASPKGSAATASSEGTASTAAKEVVHFFGTNGKSGERPQTFGGELLVSGDGTVRCTRCDAMNKIGYGLTAGSYGYIDYRSLAPASSANQSAAAANAPSASGSPGVEKQPPSNPPNAGGGR
jgi:Domain of unknown function (DUF4157)